MSDIISIVIPIVLILCLGFYCKEKKILNRQAIDGIKNVSVRFLWPMVLFYAFFTASYSVETIFYAGVNFATNLFAFAVGLVLRKTKCRHSFSYPYLLSGFETGMIGYPLYTLLFGAENISCLALLDVGHALFIFPIFLNYLSMEQGKTSLKDSIRDMFTSPIMIALIVGMISGMTGIGSFVMNSVAGVVVTKLYGLISDANVVMILIVMGYNLSFSFGELKESAKVILIRSGIMTFCGLVSFWILRKFVTMNVYLVSALIVTYIMPPVYMLSVYVKDKEENEFMSTTSSAFTMLSILLFLLFTIIVK